MQKNQGSGHNISIGNMEGNLYLDNESENIYSKIVAKDMMRKIIYFDEKYNGYKDNYGFIGFLFHILTIIIITMYVTFLVEKNTDLSDLLGVFIYGYFFLGFWGWPMLSIFLFYNYSKKMFEKIIYKEKLGLSELKEVVVLSDEYEAKNKKNTISLSII